MDPLSYYRRRTVAEEISVYCRRRWVAVHSNIGGRLIFKRYMQVGGDRVPITISTPEELARLVGELRARTVYATIHEYHSLAREEDTALLSNIARSSPIWDIDSTPAFYKATLEAARAVVDELERLGVVRSVFLKWSGRGVHVHLNPLAFSHELLKRMHPADAAYSIVEYVKLKVDPRVHEVSRRYEIRGLKLENRIDAQRAFTAPLSLHRLLDFCCICFAPEDIDSFELNWALPSECRHDKRWKTRYLEGEADHLAKKAYEVVGGMPYPRVRRRRKTSKLDEMIRRSLREFTGSQPPF